MIIKTCSKPTRVNRRIIYMNDFFVNLSHEVYVFLLAAVPLIELRGAIPLGIGLGMSPWEAYWISVAGSTLPAPFLILFFRKIL